jgi:DNA-binding transcriptional LysR family regulator
MVALQQVHPDAHVTFRSNSSAAQHEAVAAGYGLGMLHAFAADTDRRLVRILREEVHVKRSYWLVMHRDLQKLPRVRAIATFLEDVTSTLQKVF